MVPLHRGRVYRADQVCGVRLLEVLLDLLARGKLDGLGDVQGGVLRTKALLFEPLLHDGLVLGDAHACLVRLEGHPPEALGMDATQLLLVAVVVGRPQHLAADPALRHERVRALRRVRRDLLRRVERVEMLRQHVPRCVCLRQPHRVVQRADKQRLLRVAVLALDHPQDHVITIRLLHHQRGHLEQRIRPAAQPNLLGKRCNAVRLRDEGAFHRDQGFRTRPAVVPAVAPATRTRPASVTPAAASVPRPARR